MLIWFRSVSSVCSFTDLIEQTDLCSLCSVASRGRNAEHAERAWVLSAGWFSGRGVSRIRLIIEASHNLFRSWCKEEYCY